MQRVEGVDAGYLYMETPSMHMHTLKIGILAKPPLFDFAYFRSEMMARLQHMPPLHYRIVPVPLALNHPTWVFDHDIDPDRHIFHHRLPDGSGMEDLEDLVGEIASTPLDRTIPLWELHVVEGMSDGRIGTVGKIHHTLADGNAANAMLGNLTDQETARASTRPPPRDEPVPSALTQIGVALWDAAVQMLTLPRLIVTTVTGVVGLVRHKRASEVATPRPILDVPRASFNRALTPRRSFATASVELSDLRRVRAQHGVTLNDVVLAVVSGALRLWMGERGETHAGSLVAGVPVGTDADAPPGAPKRMHGNRVSNLFTTLATDVEDPVERMLQISRVTKESKKVVDTLGPDLLREWVQFTPPAPFSALLNLYSRLRAASRHAPPLNLIVSNVRGPGEVVTIGGAELSDLFSVGPLLEGIGLNVTAWSYAGRMNFSLLSCPDLVEDLRSLSAQVRPALDELLSTCQTTATEPRHAAPNQR